MKIVNLHQQPICTRSGLGIGALNQSPWSRKSVAMVNTYIPGISVSSYPAELLQLSKLYAIQLAWYLFSFFELLYQIVISKAEWLIIQQGCDIAVFFDTSAEYPLSLHEEMRDVMLWGNRRLAVQELVLTSATFQNKKWTTDIEHSTLNIE